MRRSSGVTVSGRTVVIIDSGVDRNNPYLAGRVINEACFSAGNACPNGAAYLYSSTNRAGVVGSANPCGGYSTVMSGCEHGTEVAHIAAGAYGVA